jgi:membrane protease YdiL (CAAX protease family)
MEHAWLAAPPLVVVLGGGIAWGAITRRLALAPLVLAASYLALDTYVVIRTPNPGWVSWNWAGKLAELALAGIAIIATQSSRAELGLVMPAGTRARRATLVGVAVAVAFDAALNALFSTGEPTSLETVLYQATMPGVAEELVFRGVAFALLVRAFGGATAPRSSLGAAIVTTLAFGVGHGVSFDNATLGFAVMPFLFAAALGGWFAWIRCRTGSVLGCVIAHNAANVAGTLIATL